MISPNPAVVVAVLALVGGIVAQERSTFSMRALATDDYNEDGVTFDLKAEQKRLQIWLSIQGHKEMLEHEPLFINVFNWLETKQGGPLSSELDWFPRKILPVRLRNDEVWEFSHAMSLPEEGAVRVFSDSEWGGGFLPDNAPEYLLELFPINLHDTHFTQEDFDRESLRLNIDEDGRPAIGYGVRADRQDAFAHWTERMIGKKAAIVVNGLALNAPVFRGRIRNSGQITGGFTENEAEDLVESLRASIGNADDAHVAAEVMIKARIALVQLLHDSDEQVRLEAVVFLGGLGDQAKLAVPQLMQVLGDKSARIRLEAITALGMIGPAAKDAIPTLEKLTEHEDRQTAERARAALRQVRGR
jgi:hypothetical protein